MTIARPAHSPWQITCNKCSTTTEHRHNATLEEVVVEIKAAGWRAFKRFSKWAHHCPKCTAPKVDAHQIAQRWTA